MRNLVEIRELDVRFHLREGVVRAVNGLSLDIAPHRTLAIVGESGCGKSITARALLQILPPRGRIEAGSIRLAPREGADASWCEIASLPPDSARMRSIRGADVAMIFQEPMTSLSPVHTVGNQIVEGIRLHRRVSKRQARALAIDMLRRVGVPNPAQRVDAYPHELSGGLRQRCMIAMALACRPRLLIADEPTTALDVTIQAQILLLMVELQKEFGMAILLITHDLGVVAETADDVVVMYLGRAVERAAVSALFAAPSHPYTRGLLNAIPQMGRGRSEDLPSIPGTLPDPFDEVSGCPFHPRCEGRIPGVCDRDGPPPFHRIDESHEVACHLFAPAREGNP